MFECGEFYFIDVHGEDAGFVAGKGGEVEGFAAGAGAGVNDALAGLWIEEGGDGLGGWVLDLDAAVEAEIFRKDFPGREGKGVGVICQGGGRDVVFRKPCLRFFDGGEEGVDSEEDGGFLIEGGELGFPEIAEFGVAEVVEPIGDGLADGAGLVGEV